MTTHYPVIVVGGGQAGLSISYCLKERSIEHLVFEKHTIGHEWQARRWDSFCLVTPNWQCQLPGFPYPGNDPHGFMQKDEIVDYIKRYAATFQPPIREGVSVHKVQRLENGRFAIATSIGDYTANQVVIAVGGYHKPRVPRMAERLPDEMVQLHSSEYKNPESLPDGGVLIVGTGQSGCQIAEDLHLAGRTVHLSVGSAPRSPRRYRGKDVVDWLDQMGYYDLSIDEHPQKEQARRNTNHYLTGRGGGREIDLRQFAQEGMQLYGRLCAIANTQLQFQPDLNQNLDHADQVAESIKKSIDTFIANHQIEAPTAVPYHPALHPPEQLFLDLESAHIKTVIWSTGYQSNFSWVDVPVFNGSGYPIHARGVTDVHGLYFLGLPWLYTWGSGRFSGVARDARYLADYIVTRHHVSRTTLNAWHVVNEFLLGA